MNNSIKNYFENEVSDITAPPMPRFKKKRIMPWDNLLLAAIAVTSMVIIGLPSSYSSEIRKVQISQKRIELFADNFTGKIISTALYMQNRGDFND